MAQRPCRGVCRRDLRPRVRRETESKGNALSPLSGLTRAVPDVFVLDMSQHRNWRCQPLPQAAADADGIVSVTRSKSLVVHSGSPFLESSRMKTSNRKRKAFEIRLGSSPHVP